MPKRTEHEIKPEITITVSVALKITYIRLKSTAVNVFNLGESPISAGLRNVTIETTSTSQTLV